MNKFIYSCILFFSILILFFSIGLVLPNNSPSRSIDYSLIKKHKLLKNIKGNKLILTGGSNVLFGFNSKLISDHIKKPVINHAIHAGYGMKYILDDIEPFINKGDILVFSPEYSHFIDRAYLGKEPLLFSLTAIPKNLNLISLGQLFNILPFLPKFSMDRIKSFIYYIIKKDISNSVTETKTYSEHAISSYGDNNTHWTKGKQQFDSYEFNGKINLKAFEYLEKFQERITQKGAQIIVVYPSLCETSFSLNSLVINQINKKFKEYKININGVPKDFSYSDELFFDTPYHLNGKGVQFRTGQIVKIIEKMNH